MKLIAFTCPSCAISYCFNWRLWMSHTEQIPLSCVVASKFGKSVFQSKFVTGALCSALLTLYRRSQRGWTLLSSTSQILTNSPAVARMSFLDDVWGIHISLEGGYSCGKSNDLTSRCVVYGCWGCSLLVVVASINHRISTLLFCCSIDKLPTARVISESPPFWNAIELTRCWKVYRGILTYTWF